VITKDTLSNFFWGGFFLFFRNFISSLLVFCFDLFFSFPFDIFLGERSKTSATLRGMAGFFFSHAEILKSPHRVWWI